MPSSTRFRLPPTARRRRAVWNSLKFPWGFQPSSSPASPSRLPLLASAALCAAVVAQMAWSPLMSPFGGDDLPVSAPPVPMAGDATATPMPGGHHLTLDQRWPAIGARPIFAPTRQPSRTRETGPSPLDTLTVVGIMAGDGGGVAVLRQADGKTMRVKVGQMVAGWTLQAAMPERLDFQRNGDTRSLLLDSRKLRPAAPPQSPAARGKR